MIERLIYKVDFHPHTTYELWMHPYEPMQKRRMYSLFDIRLHTTDVLATKATGKSHVLRLYSHTFSVDCAEIGVCN